jgi:hypothetical protein
MEGNPQNIEVGDVVQTTTLDEVITAQVLSIWNQGYISIDDEKTIDGYLVRASIVNKGSISNFTVGELTIVRKWDGTIPEQNQEKVKKTERVELSVQIDKESKNTIDFVCSCYMIPMYLSAKDDNTIVIDEEWLTSIVQFINREQKFKDGLYLAHGLDDVTFMDRNSGDERRISITDIINKHLINSIKNVIKNIVIE